MEIDDMKIIPYYEDSRMVGVTLKAPPGFRFDISNSDEVDLVLWNCKELEKLKKDEHGEEVDGKQP